MSKYNRRNDSNETTIKNELIARGYHVVSGHDDLLIFKDINEMFQLEVKTKSPFQKNGKIKTGFIKDNQYEQLCKANNQYFIGWDIKNIKWYLEGQKFPTDTINPSMFRKYYEKLITTKELNRLKQKPWWCL